MFRDDWVYVGHMLDMCQQALDITIGKDKPGYDRDITLRLALTHLIQVIGEAAQHVSEQFKQSHPEVPWHEIIGMRHRIVHDYLNVDEDIVWEVTKTDLPHLLTILKHIVPSEYK